ncbi:MAG: urease accessory UreF family protein [Caldimonas sp.]
MSDDIALTPAAVLRLMRLASPSLPVGGFSYSEGMESAVDTGFVATEAQALCWLSDQLHLGLARSELPIVAAACTAWQQDDRDEVVALNSWFSSTRESAEQRQQAEQMGRSLAQWLANGQADAVRLAVLQALRPAPTWPVAFALAATQGGASPASAVLAFAAGWAESMVQAAMKSVPLGQAAGQRILDALALQIEAKVEPALRLEPARRQAFTPMLAILSSQHEAQYSRLFRS